MLLVKQSAGNFRRRWKPVQKANLHPVLLDDAKEFFVKYSNNIGRVVDPI
jgi:hypothetical protein